VFEFQLKYLMRLTHYIVSLMYIPKNFVYILYWISLSSNICDDNGLLLCEVKKDIVITFLALTTRLLSSNHVCDSFKTLLTLYWSWSHCPLILRMIVSTTSNTILESILFRGKSLCIIKIILGQVREAWGKETTGETQV
jgi:hypothetical protein